MRINPQDKMCGNGKMEKHVLRECFESYLPASVAWRQKEQFSDGVGYSWIDTLKEVAAEQISDQQLETASFRFPYNTPSSKEAYLYREIFEELFPVPSAAECVPGGPSVACSSAKAIEWDESFKNERSVRTRGWRTSVGLLTGAVFQTDSSESVLFCALFKPLKR